MRLARFRIRTLMIVVAVAGLASWFAANPGLVDIRRFVLVTVGSLAVIGIITLFCIWGWVAFSVLRPRD